MGSKCSIISEDSENFFGDAKTDFESCNTEQELDDRSSSMCVNLSSRYVKLVPFICTNQMDESSLFKTGKVSDPELPYFFE